jgi:exodeoxyribonuclease VII large subunit
LSEAVLNNVVEWSVSELSAALKRTVEDAYGYVRVRGEISGFRGVHSSGHCYFSLKDESAKLDAVIWRTTLARMRVKPEEGLEVVVSGKLTTFPGQSRYQIVIDRIELAGIGALMKLLEERKKKLAAEGLFDEARKQLLPYLPNVIAVVTSPTGAVIRDILHRLSDRFPRRVLVWPVRVQGETSAAEVAAAIRGFNALPESGPLPRPDVIIVARGGGSLEDLWSFNEEIVVRAASESEIPLISAVGHETDVTLIDFAADRRAPTPTAAAEMAVPVRLELMGEVSAKAGRLASALRRFYEGQRLRLDALRRGLPDPQSLIGLAQQRLDDRAERLVLALAGLVDRRRHALAVCAGRLADPRQALRQRRERVAELGHRLDAAMPALLVRCAERVAGLAARIETHRRSHEQVLERGYAVVRNAAGIPVTSAQAVLPGALTIEFHDGEVAVNASGKRRGKKTEPEQPKLL